MNATRAGLLFFIVGCCVVFALFWLSVPPYKAPAKPAATAITTVGVQATAKPTSGATATASCPSDSFAISVASVSGNKLTDIFGKSYQFEEGLKFQAGLSYRVVEVHGKIARIVNYTGNPCP